MGPARPADQKDLKRRVSSQILELQGVSGIGIPKGQLTVYLEVDSKSLRSKVRDIVKSESPRAEVAFAVTGKFSKRNEDR